MHDSIGVVVAHATSLNERETHFHSRKTIWQMIDFPQTRDTITIELGISNLKYASDTSSIKVSEDELMKLSDSITLEQAKQEGISSKLKSQHRSGLVASPRL